MVGATGQCYGQLVSNEGSNKNYSTISDEDGDFEDWIEIFNAGTVAIDLFNYSLSDNSNPGEWVFPHQIIQPNEYVVVFCSGKDRYSTSAFTSVLNDTTFQPQSGWNTHHFETPFYWDGISNIVLNICTYNPFYTSNSIHLQSATPYKSSTIAVNDGSPACAFSSGGNALQRPNIRFNSIIADTGNLQNSYTDYPAPYSNWYGGSRQQYLYKANELIAAGLAPGNIESIAFYVVEPCPTGFASLDLSMANTRVSGLTENFIQATGSLNHTNFKISSNGETIKLYNPSNVQISSLNVNGGPGYDVSTGRFPDVSSTIKKFNIPTPGTSNNTSVPADNYASAPVFSVNSGVYISPFSVSISAPNVPGTSIYYTLDGSNPDTSSILWNGSPVSVFQSTILRARTYTNGLIPSTITSASYLFSVNHTTPIISVISDPNNLFGPTGMFDNHTLDLLKPSSIDYFDSTATHNLLFSRRAGIVMDGGWGSRGLPQRPFRIKFDDGVLGQGPVLGKIIPDRPSRNQYSDFMLRNGSNQYLILPYKDAAQTKMMADGTNNYYSAWRPVSVYINGAYWGLYELREKFNTEMFETLEDASENSIDILSSSAQYGFQLRAVEGDLQGFYDSYDSFLQLNPSDDNFWPQADQYFDMTYYNDYIIGELWMNNADWGFNYNNIKIYRSNATNYRWRYCLMDMEYGLLPNPSNDFNCTYDLLQSLINWPSTDPGNPHLNIFLKGIQNDRFRNYFINRFADLMNTLYLPSRLLAIENAMFDQTLFEMANEYQRWGDPTDVPAQMNSFYQNHFIFQDELTCRPENARNYIQSNFNLPKQVDVQLDVYPSNAGKINISTITPDTYPWGGVYFDGVPVKIEAVALPGFQFSHWEPNGLLTDTLNSVFIDTLTASSANFTAHYTSIVGIKEVHESSFWVYPNPTSEKITIKSSDYAGEVEKVRVFDLLGKEYSVAFSRISQTEFILNVSDLSSGYYLIKCITQDGKLGHAEFVKQ